MSSVFTFVQATEPALANRLRLINRLPLGAICTNYFNNIILRDSVQSPAVNR